MAKKIGNPKIGTVETPEVTRRKEGLRVLARMIAQVHLEETERHGAGRRIDMSGSRPESATYHRTFQQEQRP